MISDCNRTEVVSCVLCQVVFIFKMGTYITGAILQTLQKQKRMIPVDSCI